MGSSWDWTDVRLNTFALLTLLSLYLVLGRRSQPDGVELEIPLRHLECMGSSWYQ